MTNRVLLETCLPFIASESRDLPDQRHSQRGPKPLAITISRQTGSGARCVAQALVHCLRERSPGDSAPWAVFDRNLVEKVIEEHKLPARLARYMPEDRVSELADALDELLGVHPPYSTLVQQTSETILRLAAGGNVILIGRGAHVITRHMEDVFHVRLVGSLERRVQHIQELRGLSQGEALALVLQEDRGRQRYLKKYFGQDLEDPLAYHLTVNTDAVSYQDAARLIADAALGGCKGPSRVLSREVLERRLEMNGSSAARVSYHDFNKSPIPR